MQPSDGPKSAFFNFCDALEVKDGVSAPASGWGLENALSAWGNYFKTVTIPKSKRMAPSQLSRLLIGVPSLVWSTACAGIDVETCLGTYDANATYWNDLSVDK